MAIAGAMSSTNTARVCKFSQVANWQAVPA
jgi:hypothetical protein